MGLLLSYQALEKVEELLDVSNNCWNNQKLGVALSSTSAISALQTPISWFNQTGSIFWPHVPSGEFTVKSGYHVLKSLNVVRSPDPSTSVSIDDIIWKELWGLNIPQKVKLFLWKACHNLLPVKDNLFKKRLSICNICPICNLESETVEHALLICPWTRPVWFGMQTQIVPTKENISSFHHWFAQAVRFFGDLSSINSFGLVSFCLTLWSIWKGRNSVVFDNVHPNPMSTIQSTCGLIAEVHTVYSLKTSSSETQVSNPHLNTSHTHSKPNVVWTLPLGGNLKLNTDASFFAGTNSASSGVIVRNYLGLVVAGSARVFSAPSALVAEALAIRDALVLAYNLNFPHIVVESDSLIVVQCCRGELVRGQITSIINDILTLKGNFIRCGFTWVAREGNKAANIVASLVANGSLPQLWTVKPPDILRLELLKDRSRAINRTPFPGTNRNL
jgi:ribonuclease HI